MSQKESKGVSVFPSRKANVFPAPSLLPFARHPVSSQQSASFDLELQSPVTLLSI